MTRDSGNDEIEIHSFKMMPSPWSIACPERTIPRDQPRSVSGSCICYGHLVALATEPSMACAICLAAILGRLGDSITISLS